MSSLEYSFNAHLEKIIASLKSSTGHASGPKKPSLGQTESGEK